MTLREQRSCKSVPFSNRNSPSRGEDTTPARRCRGTFGATTEDGTGSGAGEAARGDIADDRASEGAEGTLTSLDGRSDDGLGCGNSVDRASGQEGDGGGRDGKLHFDLDIEKEMFLASPTEL